MWSAHPQSPRASCEANIAKWMAQGTSQREEGRPQSKENECVPGTGQVCAKVWVQMCRIPRTEHPGRASRAQNTDGLSEGPFTLWFGDRVRWGVGCEVSGLRRVLFQTFQAKKGASAGSQGDQVFPPPPFSMWIGERGLFCDPLRCLFMEPTPSALPSGHPQS